MLLTQFSFRGGKQKPRNYRGRLSYVNLEAAGTSLSIDYSAYRQHLYHGAARDSLYALFNLALIFFTANKFGANYHGGGDAALMHL